jgi:cytochrome c peroxidase
MALEDALKAEILKALISTKGNLAPLGVRLAWHASGTYSKYDGTGGLDGATMRFDPESADDANAGIGIVRDALLAVQQKFPSVSVADIWGL